MNQARLRSATPRTAKTADMLRLPPYQYHRPGSLAEAVALMAEHSDDAMYVSGGTDLVPNMKKQELIPED